MIPALLVLALACGSRLPSELSACEDTPCREAWVVDRWPDDPETTLAALDKVEDPVERIVLVTKIVETWPGETASLCERLTQGPARTRCERINSRPHLRSDPPEPPANTRRAAGGPRTQNIAPPPANTSRFYQVAPLTGPCVNRREPHVCYSTQALREARISPQRAAAACVAMGESKWVSECQFSAAEMLINAKGIDGLHDAVDLCVASPPFAGNCLAHLIVMLATRTPDATEATPDGWKPVMRMAEAIEQEWRVRDPEQVELYVDRFWSESMAMAYVATPEVTGGPLSALPEAAWRHVRASATFRLMQLEGPGAHPTVDAWVDAVAAALDRRAAETFRPVPPPPPKSKTIDEVAFSHTIPGGIFQGKENLWNADLPGDEVWPATFFWGTARRTWLSDARQDLEICVLEAAGQLAYTSRASGDKAVEAAARALLVQGQSSTLPAAKWTADRILKNNLPDP